MIISTPNPIPGSDSKSPLLPSGANFPCQGADLTTGTVNNIAIGEAQPLIFNLGGGANTAVHGGGSCQVSMTYETDATTLKNPSAWKVIHTIQGGCMTLAPGNLDNSVPCTGSNAPNCVNQNFTYTVPSSAKAGNAIIAWTWFNNIGNREMYMNCARAAVTGSGSGDMTGLPDLFTANIGNNCATTETTTLQIPNPGLSVDLEAAPNFPFKAPVGTGCQAAGAAAAAPAANSSAPAAVSAAPAAQSSGGNVAEGPITSTTYETTTTTLYTSVYATGGSVVAPSVAPAVAAPSAASAAPAAVPAASQAPAGQTSGSCFSGQVACTASGFYCISETSWAECAFGCAIPMDVAAGTACANNAIIASKTKKSLVPLKIRQVARRSLWDWGGLSNWF
jgi:hypothetical protein